MHVRPSRTLSWDSVIGVGLLSAAMAMGVVAYSGRRTEGPLERESRARAPHRCDDPGCTPCRLEREWLERNPGRYSGDLAERAEEPYAVSGRVSITAYPED